MEHVNQLLPVGTLLCNGTYRIEQPLRSGGFGNTYIVRHMRFDVLMVVKEFFMKGINLRGEDNTVTVSVPDNRATFESQREKFKKEAQRLWKLRSAHIVGVHDIFEENGTVYYIMDFIDGESLEERLERKGAPLPEDEVRDILAQLLDALATIHNNKPRPIFHLDIKPSNILIGHDGRLVLIDFGASKQLSGDHEGVTSTMITYTRGYAPFEQIDGNPECIGACTDLYALGATLYKLLTTNQPPDPSAIINEGQEAFPFPVAVSSQMKGLIVWLMQPNRKKRPQSVQQVRERLEKGLPEENVVKGGAVSDDTVIRPASGPQPVPKPKPGWEWAKLLPRLRYALLALVAVGCVVASYYILRPDEPDTDNLPATAMESTVPPQPAEPEDEIITVNGVSFKMIRVEGGTFQMGSNDGYDDEKPPHRVTVSSFLIGETEVTQELWQAVMGGNPSKFKGSKLPVERVSWEDICGEDGRGTAPNCFLYKLNQLTGKKFRLPTEAEWEYAARGGSKSQNYTYSGSDTIDVVAWYNGNSSSTTHEVATKSPNELGIYDMSGNVWEWCQDWKGDYSSGSQTNPTGPSSGSDRVNRGGSWDDVATYCRVANRNYYSPTSTGSLLGLRLAR